MGCSRRWLVSGIALAASLALATALGVAAQQPGGPGGPGGPGFGGPGFGGLLDLVRRTDVRKELELLDEQVQKLDKLEQGRGERMRQTFSGLEDVPREQRFEKMRELMRKEQQQTEKDIGQILLPHQMKRLKQLEVQNRSRGGGQALLSERTGEELGLTTEQKESLRKKAAELEEQIRKKLTEMRKQAQDEMLQLLTPAQRAKWKEMVGDPFEFQRQEPPRFGGPGGQGGPGATGGQPRPGSDRSQRPR